MRARKPVIVHVYDKDGRYCCGRWAPTRREEIEVEELNLGRKLEAGRRWRYCRQCRAARKSGRARGGTLPAGEPFGP